MWYILSEILVEVTRQDEHYLSSDGPTAAVVIVVNPFHARPDDSEDYEGDEGGKAEASPHCQVERPEQGGRRKYPGSL